MHFSDYADRGTTSHTVRQEILEHRTGEENYPFDQRPLTNERPPLRSTPFRGVC